MRQSIKTRSSHDVRHSTDPLIPNKESETNNDVHLGESKKENWRIELLKMELDEMRFIRSGADMALIVAECLPMGDLRCCAKAT